MNTETTKSGKNGHSTKQMAWAVPAVKVKRRTVAEMNFTVMDVTPGIAAEWLKQNDGNRKINDATVEKYVTDMKTGNWILSATPIAIDHTGAVVDGQHRLTAVVRSGKTVKMAVVSNAPADSRTVVDIGLPRSLRDMAQFVTGEQLSTLYCASAKAMMRGSTATWPKTTRQMDLAFISQHRSALDFVVSTVDQCHIPGIRRAAVAAVFARAFYTIDHDKLNEFLGVLISGVQKNQSHRIIGTLRDYLMTHPAHGRGLSAPAHVVYRKTARALLAFLNKESIRTLYEVSEEPFKIPGEGK